MIIPLKDDCYFEGKTLVTRSIMVVCLVALLATLSLFPVGSHPVEMAMNLSRVRETHVAFSWGRMVPAIGASGAVSGVMAAYWLMFPRTRVLALVGPVPMRMPANVCIAFWFLLAITMTWLVGNSFGVAFAAHAGGFLAGAFLVRGPLQPGMTDD